MSLIGVIIGTICQVILAWPLFLFAGIGRFGWFSVLPLSCFLSAGIVIYLYTKGASADAYLWYGLPVVLSGLVFASLPK